MKLIILLAMVFCHLIADYNLQGILAQFKQKQWWKDNYPDDMYKNDWFVSLIEHSFMWSFVTHLPILYWYWGNDSAMLWISFWIIWQTVAHAAIDHTKANLKEINLCNDQFWHMIQILISWMYLIIIGVK